MALRLSSSAFIPTVVPCTKCSQVREHFRSESRQAQTVDTGDLRSCGCSRCFLDSHLAAAIVVDDQIRKGSANIHPYSGCHPDLRSRDQARAGTMFLLLRIGMWKSSDRAAIRIAVRMSLTPPCL